MQFTLPLLEQDNLYKPYNFTVAWDNAANDGTAAKPKANQSQPKIFLCPSAPGGRVRANGRGVIDYSPPSEITRPNPFVNKMPASDPTWIGVLGHNTARRIAEISDGTSNTLLLAEDAGRDQEWVMGKEVSTGGATGAWANPGTAITVGGYDPATGKQPGPCAVNCLNNNEISAFHPAGANVLFADGHSQMLRAGLDVNIVIALLTRAGGEVVPANEF